MKFNPIAILFLFVTTVCAAQTTTDDVWGYVEGRVVDQQGDPLSEATVTAWTDGRGLVRSVTQYDTDEKGVFKLKFPEGKVWLSAHKKSEGYPYSFFGFFETPGQEFPTVEVKAREITKDVVIRVGVKAAHLVYEVANEEGNQVLGGFTFERLDQPGRSFMTSALAKDDMLVPPAPFRATFEAKGYKLWHYGGEHWQGKEGIISLKSGETLNLSIRLEQLP